MPIYHFDTYRLWGESEFWDLGAGEYFAGEGVCFVEWADRVPKAMPAERLDLRFEVLSPTILERSSVLYIWVDPAESRRKNIARGQPNAQGSILHHCVPMEVMLGQYGTDDMAYLMSQSDRPGTIRIDRIIEQDGRYETRTYRLPVARLDNRVDKTTFVRVPRAQWRAEDVKALHEGLAGAFAELGQSTA